MASQVVAAAREKAPYWWFLWEDCQAWEKAPKWCLFGESDSWEKTHEYWTKGGASKWWLLRAEDAQVVALEKWLPYGSF